MKKNLKVLTIAFYVPPLKSAQALSCLKTLRGLSGKNITIGLLTGDHPTKKNDNLLSYMPDNVEFFRAPLHELPFWYKRILFHIFPFIALTPDIHKTWAKKTIPYALKTAELFSPDILYTRSQPFSDHIIGYEIKKKYPKLPWVVYMSDPLVDNPYYYRGPIKFHKKINKILEAKIFSLADEIHFVSEETTEKAEKRYIKDISSKFRTIPHGYEPQFYKLNSDQLTNNPFKILYTGGFVADRNPISLLKALLKIDEKTRANLKIDFIGPASILYKKIVEQFNLTDVVSFLPSQQYPDILHTMGNYNLLLLFDADYPEYNIFFPSKLVDYLGSCRPILGLTPDDSTSARILDEFKQPHVSPNNISSITDILTQCVYNPPVGFNQPLQYSIYTIGEILEKRFRYLIK